MQIPFGQTALQQGIAGVEGGVRLCGVRLCGVRLLRVTVGRSRRTALSVLQAHAAWYIYTVPAEC